MLTDLRNFFCYTVDIIRGYGILQQTGNSSIMSIMPWGAPLTRFKDLAVDLYPPECDICGQL